MLSRRTVILHVFLWDPNQSTSCPMQTSTLELAASVLWKALEGLPNFLLMDNTWQHVLIVPEAYGMPKIAVH